MEQHNWMIPQACCWIKGNDKKVGEQLFYKGIITDGQRNQDQIKACYEQGETQQGEVQIVIQNVFQRDESQEEQYFEDMVQMATLNEAELLHNIQRRYVKDQIFTYIGPTLIVINPYKPLNAQFNESIIQNIKNNLQTNTSLFNLQQQEPHIYAISALSFKNLFDNSKKQAIVISGESGAGKTENAKYAMKFLTQLSHNRIQDEQKNMQSELQQKQQISIEDRILSCNPLLEAFGNAKTVRNDNSSRFGKYVKMLVNKQQRIVGAEITKYLLEKSRVIHLSEGERNYHIFYHILEGGDQHILEKIHLKDKKIDDFTYLNQSTCRSIDDVNDKDMFKAIMDSLSKMSFSPNLEISVFKLLSTILYLGNLEFDDSQYDVNTPCKIANEEVLQTISELLEIKPDQMREAFTKKTRQTPNQVIASPVNKNECMNNKNSLSKALYDKLFTWLVGKLNQGIIPDAIDLQKQQLSSTLSIGLLDIFGFENFKINSFEQMCINYTNEYLQQLYISYVFKNEEKIFVQDGLQNYLANLSYEDNQVILDLFDSSNGIFGLLNESCMLKNSSDTNFLNKIKEQHNTNKKVIFPKLIQFNFTVCHTQSQVEYNVEGFREKNMDEVSQEIQNCITQCQNLDIVDIFTSDDNSISTNISSNKIPFSSSTSKNKYLCSKFKLQMTELMLELNSSDVHFVRCIKPNELKRKECFQEGYVMQQIRYLGVLESIEVRKHTYPVRKEFEAFFKQYRMCSDVLEYSKRKDYKEMCRELLIECFKTISDKQVLFGITKIYLKQEYQAQLDILRFNTIQRKQTQAVITIQSIYRIIRKQNKQKTGIKGINSQLQQIIFDRQLYGFEKIKSKAKQYVLARFVNQFNSLQRANLIVTFYAIKENYLMLKTIEELQKEQENKMKQIEMEENKQKTILQQQKQEQEQEQGQEKNKEQSEQKEAERQRQKSQQNMPQKQYNQLLNEQYDTNFSSRNYQTSIVEPSGAVIDQNKYYYQGDEEDIKRQQYKTNQMIDLNNYNSKLIKDWNQFSMSDQEFNGDTIFIPRASQEENERAVKLSNLLDTKPSERVDEPEEMADDCTFKLTDLDVDEDMYKEIKSLDFIGFFKKHLNKRTNMLGVKRDEKDILTYQKKTLSKGSLIQVNDIEKKPALQHFIFILDMLQSESTNDLKTLTVHISDLVLLCLKKSTQFYNEVVTQIIKQLNKNKKANITIKLLQYLKVFLYCFTPDDEFLTALMHFLIFYLHDQQWKTNSNVQSYILYNIPSIIRKIDQENPRQLIFQSQIPMYEISALIQKQKIAVPIVFSTGLSISICADAWDTVEQLKEKIMNLVQINTERIKVSYLQIFELQFEDNQASEKMLLPDQYIWDILFQQNQRQIEKAQFYNQQNNNNMHQQTEKDQEMFMAVLMIRVIFPFTIYPDDIAGISLIFSQVFFDIYVGKQIFHEDEKLIQLGALLKVINNFQNTGQTDTISSLPLIMDQKSKEDMVKPIIEEYNRINGKLTLLQAKYIYLMIAKDNKYYMGLQIPVKYIPESEIQRAGNQQEKVNNEYRNDSDSEFTSNIECIIVLKPTFFFIITAETKKPIIEYSYQRVLRWGRSKEGQKDHILINTNDNAKHLIQSKYAQQIDFYLQEAKNLITEKVIQSPSIVEELLEYLQPNQS